MSNCYDHEYKANMLDSYYWDNKVEAKKNLSKNLNKLTDWYKAEQKKYERAMWYFDDWYTEYTGGSWEENNISKNPPINKSPSPWIGWKNIVRFEGGSIFSSTGLFNLKKIIARIVRNINAIHLPIVLI